LEICLGALMVRLLLFLLPTRRDILLRSSDMVCGLRFNLELGLRDGDGDYKLGLGEATELLQAVSCIGGTRPTFYRPFHLQRLPASVNCTFLANPLL
jgi:hypothetical protein